MKLSTLAVATVVAVLSNTGSVEGSWVYRLSSTSRSYSSANQDCADTAGTQLASIHTIDQNQAMSEVPAAFQVEHAWIGLNDESHEGCFKWTDGSVVNFMNFQVGEPNNLGGEDCAHFWKYNPTWNDLPCSHTMQAHFCNANANRDFDTIRGDSWVLVRGQGAKDWAGANQACKDMYGTELATVADQTNDENMVAALKHFGVTDAWMGLQRAWANGAAITYTNFVGQDATVTEHCYHFSGADNHFWQATACDGTFSEWFCNV